MEMTVSTTKSIFKTSQASWLEVSINNLVGGLTKTLARIGMIARAAAFLLACLSLISAFLWIGFGDYFSADLPLTSGSSYSANSGTIGETSSEGNDFWQVLTEFFQVSNYFDGVWPQINEFEKAKTKAVVNFNQPFLDWLERDRSRFQQIGNTKIYSDGENTVLVYQ
jgi:hypothetical protein